jgi:hypothetical protein
MAWTPACEMAVVVYVMTPPAPTATPLESVVPVRLSKIEIDPVATAAPVAGEVAWQVSVTLCDGVMVAGDAEHAMVTGMSTVYEIDVVLLAKLALPVYVAVIVCTSEISVVGGVDAVGAGCVPADRVVVAVDVTTPLPLTVTLLASVVDVVVSVIVVLPDVTPVPLDVTFVVAVNVTDVPYPSGDAGLAVSVVVVGAAAADAIDVCAKNPMASANKTLNRVSKNRVSDCAVTKAPFRTTHKEAASLTLSWVSRRVPLSSYGCLRSEAFEHCKLRVRGF